MSTDAKPADPGAAAPVSEFLGAALAAEIPACDVWADDATLDATVPGGRFHARGPEAIKEIFSAWYCEPGEMVELHRDPIADGEVVRYLVSSTADGEPYVAHHLHRITVVDGRITADVVFCGGRWPVQGLSEMRAADEIAAHG
jgi:hypothetical protein